MRWGPRYHFLPSLRSNEVESLILHHQSLRVKILAFLLSQRVHATLSTPWTEYVRYLPEEIFVPTMWHDHELPLLQGTSLEVSPCELALTGGLGELLFQP